MKKVTISKLCCACIAFSLLALTSCMEKDLYGKKNNETPSLATFATTQDVQFSMLYNVPSGYSTEFAVYSENPVTISEDGTIVLRTDIQPIAAGIVDEGNFNMMKKIPSYVKELYAYTGDLYASRLMHATINNGTATFKAVDFSSLIPQTAAMNTRSTADKTLDLAYVPEVDSRYTPAMDGYMDIPLGVFYSIKSFFPNGKSLFETNKGQYVQDATMEVTENTELWISPLITDCSKINTLGYICFDGPKSSIPADMSQIDEKLITVFPWASLENNPVAYAGYTGLNAGQMFKLKYYDKKEGKLVDTFPKGTTIIWFLASGIYNRDTKTFNSSSSKAQNFFYSHSAWNTYEADNLKCHTAYYSVKNGNETYTCFAFEDTKRTENVYCDNDFNDLVFVMKANPASAITPPIIVDGDDDPIIVEEKKFGVLAFEDNWPSAGDYDMNDVVVTYNSKTSYYKEVSSLGTCVVSINDVFNLVHSGATYHNSFSIKYDIAPNKVTSVLVNGQSVQPRADGDGFVVKVFDDALAYIKPFEFGQSKEFNVVVSFVKNQIKQADFQSKVAPYNPFISPKDGIEVHLPMQKPTTEADTNYFGTMDDCSDPDKGIYYVGKEGSIYPWAIHLANIDDFVIPTEKEAIDATYPLYKTWVESGFSQTYSKWYIK